MHIKIRKFIPCFLSITLLLGTLSCGGSSSTNQTSPFLADYSAILDALANQVAIPTYQDLSLQASALRDAANQFQATPDDNNFQLLKLAWIAARVPWEQGEAFAFGPVGFEGFDASMDTWPIDLTGIATVLAAPDPIDLAFVQALGPSLKGYHVIEFLIYGADSSKIPGDFTARELDYLVAACQHLTDLASDLLDSWTIGINGAAPFADTLTTAGPGNLIYPTQGAAVLEIFFAMTGTLDEVANSKIGGPLEHQDPFLIESLYSQNSLADFSSNVSGVKIVYETSLQLLVLQVNLLVDSILVGKLEAALAQLDLILPPFEITVFDPSQAASIQAAIDAILAAQTSFETIVLPYIPKPI